MAGKLSRVGRGGLPSGSGRELERSDWAALAASQGAEIEALLEDPTVVELLAAGEASRGQSTDLLSARRYAARIALEALRQAYEVDFTSGLANDARLFGKVVASPSGQHWVGRFLAKDPEQSSLDLFQTP